MNSVVRILTSGFICLNIEQLIKIAINSPGFIYLFIFPQKLLRRQKVLRSGVANLKSDFVLARLHSNIRNLLHLVSSLLFLNAPCSQWHHMNFKFSQCSYITVTVACECLSAQL